MCWVERRCLILIKLAMFFLIKMIIEWMDIIFLLELNFI